MSLGGGLGKAAATKRRMSSAAESSSSANLQSSCLSAGNQRRILQSVLSEDNVTNNNNNKQNSIQKAAAKESAKPSSGHMTKREDGAGKRMSNKQAAEEDNARRRSQRGSESKATCESQCDRSKVEIKKRPRPEQRVDMARRGEKEQPDKSESECEDVIPAWPTSKMDAKALGVSLEAASIQVYSLKDYSQVSKPLAQAASSSSSSSANPNASLELDQNPSEAPAFGNKSRLVGSQSQSQSGSGAKMGGPKLSTADRTCQLEIPSKSNKNPMNRSSSSTNRSSIINSTNHFFTESPIDRMKRLFIPSPSASASASCSASNSSAVSLRNDNNNNNNNQQSNSASIFTSGARSLPFSVYKSHHFGKNTLKPSYRVYGCPLTLACHSYPISSFGGRSTDVYKQQSVPYVLTRLCNYIEENSAHLTHEGIFRVSGNARLMEKLRTLFDRLGDAPLESESVDVATSASMLKMYIRELPEPLIPTRLNGYFFSLAKKYFPHGSCANSSALAGGSAQNSAASRSSSIYTNGSHIALTWNEQQHLKAFSRDLGKILRKLPPENYNLLRYLCCFLYRVSLKQKYNKMCPEALGIVFGPNIFRVRGQSYRDIKDQEVSNLIMAAIISNYRAVFQSDLTDPLGNHIKLERIDMLTLGSQGLQWQPMRESSKAETEASTMPASASSGAAAPAAVTSNEVADDGGVGSRLKPGSEQQSVIPGDSSTGTEPSLEGTSSSIHSDLRASDEGHSSRRPLGPFCPNSKCRALDHERFHGCEHQEHEDDEEEEEEELELDEDDDGESYSGSSSASGSYCSTTDSPSLVSSSSAGSRHARHGEAAGGALSSVVSSSDCDASSYTPTSSESEPGQGAGNLDSLVSNTDDEQPDDEETALTGERAPVACSLCCGHVRSACTTDLVSVGDAFHCESPVAEASDSQAPLNTEAAREQAHEDEVATSNELPDTFGAQLEERAPKKNASARRANFDFSARRSSSASSLGRIKRGHRSHMVHTRHDQKHPSRRPTHELPASRISSHKQRKIVRNTNDQDQAHLQGSRLATNRRNHHHRTTKSSMRLRARAGNECSPRPQSSNPRGSSNRMRKQSAEPTVARRHGVNSRISSDERVSRVESLGSRGHGSGTTCECPENELGLHQYSGYVDSVEDQIALGIPIRRFHSDETLYRSSNYYTEFCDQMESIVMNNESRRRFSGYDFINAIERINLIPIGACSPIGEQPLEGFELEDNELAISDQQAEEYELMQQSNRLLHFEQEAEPALVVSLLSLIDSRYSSESCTIFEPDRKCPSVDLTCQSEAARRGTSEALDQNLRAANELISCQMDSYNEMIGLLRAALNRIRDNNQVGFQNADQAASVLQRIMDQPPDPSHDQSDLRARLEDDSLCCQVDHVAARSLATRIRTLLNEKDDETDKQNESLVEELVQLRLKQFEQINDHLASIKHHFETYHRNTTTSEHRPADGCPESSGRRMSVGCATLDVDLSQARVYRSTPEIELADSSGGGGVASRGQRPAPEEFGSRDRSKSEPTCRLWPLCPIEFVLNIEHLLSIKRKADERVELRLADMSLEQLQNEKLDLQKNLLRYEHLFGRPVMAKNAASHLYQRYKLVKIIVRKFQRHQRSTS